MQNDAQPPAPQVPVSEASSNDFGMTEDDVKSYRIKSIFGQIVYYLKIIEPTAVQVLNTIIYYTVRFIKAFVTSVFRMILGKEV